MRYLILLLSFSSEGSANRYSEEYEYYHRVGYGMGNWG
jgi:hypothetical protein